MIRRVKRVLKPDGSEVRTVILEPESKQDLREIRELENRGLLKISGNEADRVKDEGVET